MLLDEFRLHPEYIELVMARLEHLADDIEVLMEEKRCLENLLGVKKDMVKMKVYIAFSRDGFIMGVYDSHEKAEAVSETVETYEVRR